MPEATEGIVARAQHGGQRDHAHGDHGGADDAGGGGQQRADQHHRDAQAPAQLAEQPAHGVEQFLGDAALFQHRAHQHEERIAISTWLDNRPKTRCPVAPISEMSITPSIQPR
jgi:hypothetical protein